MKNTIWGIEFDFSDLKLNELTKLIFLKTMGTAAFGSVSRARSGLFLRADFEFENSYSFKRKYFQMNLMMEVIVWLHNLFTTNGRKESKQLLVKAMNEIPGLEQ